MDLGFVQILKSVRQARFSRSDELYKRLLSEAIQYGFAKSLFTRETLCCLDASNEHAYEMQIEIGAMAGIFGNILSQDLAWLGAQLFQQHFYPQASPVLVGAREQIQN